MRTISDVAPELRSLDFAIAQLRHAYTHLKCGRVVRQQEFADGLISPQIRRLERLRLELAK
jgi:hypothetical protein